MKLNISGGICYHLATLLGMLFNQYMIIECAVGFSAFRH